eukprot:TRINITY_DN21362_c0_g1_i2.p1 TRINITY_DN21362_c0_g1~~TRINITY_DN21362_c0_g1_i2.p1  ORF type:complete len:578 (+),score=97.36 TRINITY_DN21362_c0_g1_i2:109-1842(+)
MGHAMLTDDHVAELLRSRKQLREDGKFAEADAIRRELLCEGVVVVDGIDSLETEWRRLPVALPGRDSGCLCWLRRKESFCGKALLTGRHFCSEHQSSHTGRVPCPLDPKHTVPIAKLEGHLKVCQYSATPEPDSSSAFLKPGVNAGYSGSGTKSRKMPIPTGASGEDTAALVPLARGMLTALWNCKALEVAKTAEDGCCEASEFDISTIVDLATADDQGDFEPPWGADHRVQLVTRPLEVLLPPCCEPFVQAAREDRKAANGKDHVIQQASIAGHLGSADMIPITGNSPSASSGSSKARTGRLGLVEFGAGTAQLSKLVACASTEPVFLHALIDRQNVRRAADHSLRSLPMNGHGHEGGEASAPEGSDDEEAHGLASAAGHSASPLVRRVQCDICDLDLAAALADMLQQPVDSGDECKTLRRLGVIGLGKHLCGAATDLSLRCCATASEQVPFRGIAFALCCHHVCDFGSYVGRQWLLDCGITAKDFDSMRWFSKLAHSQYTQREAGESPATAGARAAAARAELGHLSKRLLDEGRLAWLRQQGWDGRLVRFVRRQTSPENALLLAWPRAQPASSQT